MYFDQLTAAFRFNHISLLISSGITFAFGFWEYIYSFRLIIREKMAPFPIWMHTFYLAHDSSWAIILFIAASHRHWNWFLTCAASALLVWNCFEIFNLYKAVTVERQEIWGLYYGQNVTPGRAVRSIIVQVAAFYGVVNILIAFMGQGSVLQWFALTNVVMAAGPGVLWARRGSRNGTSLGLGIVILLGTINTFLPTSMFVLALPRVFNTPWYYIGGAVFSLIAAANLYRIAKYPAKPRVAGAPRPIW